MLKLMGELRYKQKISNFQSNPTHLFVKWQEVSPLGESHPTAEEARILHEIK